jgi:hypothetical protein
MKQISQVLFEQQGVRRVKEGSELRNHPAVKKPFLTQQKNAE